MMSQKEIDIIKGYITEAELLNKPSSDKPAMFRDQHPEQKSDEIYLGNAEIKDFNRSEWKTKLPLPD